MKTIFQSLLLLICLTMASGVLAQGSTTPVITFPSSADPDIMDTILIEHTDLSDPDLSSNPVDSTKFHISSLEPSDPDAWFMHLWWTGDNGFSFAPAPKHNHLVPSGTQAKISAITTENYGTGGPPPLAYTFTTEHEGTELRKVLGVDSFLHVQTYRNAVIHDTMYMIVTYGNRTNDTINGRLTFETGIYAKICDNIIASNLSHYFPNEEKWFPNRAKLEFTQLGPDEERSVLIPIQILDNREDFLEMEVKSYVEGSGENSGNQSYDYFKVSPPVAHSHDPNIMIAESEAKSNCDYRGGKIHYTVKFQNDGDASTKYVRVECHLDDKVDLNSITNVKVPNRFYQFCRECDTTDYIRGAFDRTCQAIWDVDFDTRVLTIEMHNITLHSSTDPNLPRIDMARGQIEFDIEVKDNYIFGRPVVAHSEIFFDSNKSIVTNVVKTGCDEPRSFIDGGGYQSGAQPIVCQFIWWIIGILLAIILLLIILLIRSKRKRKKLLNKLLK